MFTVNIAPQSNYILSGCLEVMIVFRWSGGVPGVNRMRSRVQFNERFRYQNE